MNSRERVLKTLQHQEPDRVPIDLGGMRSTGITAIAYNRLLRYLGIEGDLLYKMGIACLLHDIGKMFIPDEILNKPGRLTPEEWQIMEHHTTYGARFLLSVPNLPPLAPLVAYEHHMNLEGTGYPRPRRPYQINLISFIVTIADFYDALSTDRPYKRAISPRKVVEIMQKMDGQKIFETLQEQQGQGDSEVRKIMLQK